MLERLSRAIARNPVRVYIYSVAVAVLGALVVFGVIDAELSDVLTTLLGVVLVVGGVERARSQVTPTGT